MKVSPVFLVLALVLGIGIGWVIRPVEKQPEPTAAAEAPKRERTPAKGESSDGAAEEIRRTATVVAGGQRGEMSEEAKKAQDRMSQAMAERHEKMDQKRIADLVQKLGLNARQEAELEAFFRERRGEVAKLFSGEAGAAPDMSKFSESRIDDMMTDLLDEQQLEAYEEVKVAERTKRIESRALKDLAKLNGIIDIREDQKDAVYEVLYEDAGAKVDRASASGSAVFGEVFDGGFGFEMDFEAADMHGDVMMEGGKETDQAAMMEAFRKAQQKRIDDRVKRLEGVLDEAQLTSYREHLESQNTMFESFVSPETAD